MAGGDRERNLDGDRLRKKRRNLLDIVRVRERDRDREKDRDLDPGSE